MSKSGTKKRPKKKRRTKARRYGTHQPAESRPAEVMTVAWSVSVVAVLLCDLLAVGVHFLTKIAPAQDHLLLLVRLLLISGSLVGVLSIGLLLLILRIRHVPPPAGFITFSLCVAVAPILVLIGLAVFS